MKFKRFDSGFKIEANNLEIFSHSLENPMIFVGIGNEEVDMYRGNFKIQDNLFSRIPLYNFEIIKEEKKKILVEFEKKLEVEFFFEKDKLEIKFKSLDNKINRFWIRIKSEKDEKIYGLGEQMSYFNLKGRVFPIWTSEPGVGRNKNTYITWRSDVENKAGGDYYWSNFPQATYISKRGYYLHLNSTAYSKFDFVKDDFTEIEVWEIPSKIIIQRGRSLLDLVKKLSNLLGRQPKLPEWVYNGLIIGAQGGSKRVEKILRDSLEQGIQVAGLWAQDWCGKKVTSFGKRLKWNWQWEESEYPGLPELIKELEKENIKFLGYVNPYLLEGTDLYKEGLEKGYFAKKLDDSEYLVDFGEFYCSVVDFTNPDAFDWFKEIIKKNMIEFGLGGWMADFGEYLPTDVKLFNGSSAMIEHNHWPVLWARCNYEALKETGKLEEIVYFMRAGAAGSQKYCSLLWAGDQSVDFSIDDGLISVVRAALSSSMTAIGMTHSDIGGYTSLFGNVRTKELFQRWTEMSAFTPFMRTHEGNRPDENFQYYEDIDTMKFLAKFTKIYTKIAPYIKKYVIIASEEGIPVQRALVLHYEDDKRAQVEDTQYLLGRDLLIAPVYEEGAKSRMVYLPDEEWIHLFTGKSYNKGEYDIEAPIGIPPVFYKKDSEFKELFESLKLIG